MSRCEKLIEKVSKVNEAKVDTVVEFPPKIWKMVKKFWPKETKELIKNGYDEMAYYNLQQAVAKSITMYGMLEFDQETGKTIEPK